jgi:hypothetical protein
MKNPPPLIGKNTAAYIARADIAEYIQNLPEPVYTGRDVWVVTTRWLFNKESRRLNAELGIYHQRGPQGYKQRLRKLGYGI